MSVAVLGSGPAGLLTALAVRQITGENPDIYSQMVKSVTVGAMYLHQPIPLLNDPDRPDHEIHVYKTGTREGYAEKIYGDPNAPTSWESYGDGIVYGWSLSRTYDILWDYFPEQTQGDLYPDDIRRLCKDYQYVLSTVPAPILCMAGHEFSRKPIWIIHGATAEALSRDHDIMEYNGEPNTPWYRYSQINGYSGYEYAQRPSIEDIAKRPSYNVFTGIKVIGNTCTCHPYDNYYRLGRFGKWKKGELTHHAYRDTLDILTNNAVQ